MNDKYRLEKQKKVNEIIIEIKERKRKLNNYLNNKGKIKGQKQLNEIVTSHDVNLFEDFEK